MAGFTNGGVPSGVVLRVEVNFIEIFEKMVVRRAVPHPDQGIRNQRKAQAQNRNEIQFSHFLRFLKSVKLNSTISVAFCQGGFRKKRFFKKNEGLTLRKTQNPV